MGIKMARGEAALLLSQTLMAAPFLAAGNGVSSSAQGRGTAPDLTSSEGRPDTSLHRVLV